MKERTWRANAFPLGGPLRSRVADLIPDKRQPQGLPFRLERKTGLGPAAQQAAPCYYVTPLRLRRFPPRGAVVVAGRQRSARNAERQPQGLSFIIWSGKRGSDPRPQPWQGCALPTELFPRWDCKYTTIFVIHKKKLIFSVAPLFTLFPPARAREFDTTFLKK